ncbi:hypothetical protein VMF7928_00510 [Vibrio marisflavi CECT 7928]|uniref:Uncharacterized protein n=1 Tax=Vibrio marisflavi CECT 7928 TaxID=634439 RepID=A0ABN8DZT2_9VIBR|nr:hypothetical protein VMF7928_00510 [Vibrio marisflavi CECT 7928]
MISTTNTYRFSKVDFDQIIYSIYRMYYSNFSVVKH